MSTLAREFANKELTGNIDGKDNVFNKTGRGWSWRHGTQQGSGVENADLWLAGCIGPARHRAGQAAACCPANTGHSGSASQHCLKHQLL